MILRALIALLALPCALAAPPETVVAKVARTALTERDLSDWQALSDCYPEGGASRRAAFMRQFEAAILDAVLTRDFTPLAPAEYQQERARIDRDTRAPDILACIKSRIDQDGRYERVYLRPLLVQRRLYERVRGSEKLQRPARRQAQAALKRARAGESFEALAAALRLERSSATVSDTPADTWEAEFIAKHLKALQPGQTAAEPIDGGDELRLVRLGGVEGGKYRFETLRIRKVSPEAYLKTCRKLSFTIADAELRDWVAGIRGNPVLEAVRQP